MGGERRPLGDGVKAGAKLGPSRWVEFAVEGGGQARIAATVERDGHGKPVCVAELVFRFLR